MDYMKDLEIDFSDLENCWKKQPTLYMEYAEEHADASRDKDKAKERLEVVKAKLDNHIRENPIEYGCDKKLTEAAIKSLVANNEEVIEATSKLTDANYDMNILAAAKTAFEHRKKALEGLTQLFASGYFADVKIPIKIKDAIANETANEHKKKLEANERLKSLKKRKKLT